MDTCGLERLERFRINLNEKNFASQKNNLTFSLPQRCRGVDPYGSGNDTLVNVSHLLAAAIELARLDWRRVRSPESGLRPSLVKSRGIRDFCDETSEISLSRRLRGGEGGIRTPRVRYSYQYNGLANSTRPTPIAWNQSLSLTISARVRAPKPVFGVSLCTLICTCFYDGMTVLLARDSCSKSTWARPAQGEGQSN